MDESTFKKILDDFLKNTNHEYFTAHSKLCFFKIQRIYNRVLAGHGPKFGDVKIHEETKLIIDGNHRYIAYKLADFSFGKISWCRNHSDVDRRINDIEIDYIEDWDENNEETIKYCSDDFLLDL